MPNNIFLTGWPKGRDDNERSKMKFENKIYLLRFMVLQREREREGGGCGTLAESS